MVKLEVIKVQQLLGIFEPLRVLYIEGLPAFTLPVNGEKDWIAPDVATIYWNNKEYVDNWLKENETV